MQCYFVGTKVPEREPLWDMVYLLNFVITREQSLTAMAPGLKVGKAKAVNVLGNSRAGQ